MRPIKTSDVPAENPVDEVDMPSYRIDLEALSERGHSLLPALLHRRCARCWAQLSQMDNPLQQMSVEEHLAKFVECCSRDPDFITRGMPILEVVFRLLLANGNTPLRLDQIHDNLMDRWTDPMRSRSISLDALRRMIEGDNYYGFAKADGQVVKTAR